MYAIYVIYAIYSTYIVYAVCHLGYMGHKHICYGMTPAGRNVEFLIQSFDFELWQCQLRSERFELQNFDLEPAPYPLHHKFENIHNGTVGTVIQKV